MKVVFKNVKPETLRTHLLNIKIYGDKPDPDFVELVRKYGVTEPIMVTPDNVIISGHRRNQAAKITDQETVPILVRSDLKTELDIEEALIIANKQREKTTEVKAREFQRLKEIEEERAKSRQKLSMGSGKKGPVNLPDLNRKGDSRDIAAAEVGMSGKTASIAAKVVKQIDDLEEAGEVEEAAELRETLNKSVSGAAKKISEPKNPAKTKFDEKGLDDLVGKLIRKIDERLGFVKSRAGHAACVAALKVLDKALNTWRASE